MGVGGQRHASAALPTGERPRTYHIGGWMSPRGGLDKWEKSRTHRDWIYSGHSACSKSLYRL